MARFNKPSSTVTRTTNLAGGPAFVESPKLELISVLLTSFLQDKYYRSSKEEIQRIRDLIAAEKDKLWVAKAAIYARNEHGMRSISHLVGAEIAHQVKGERWTRKFFDKLARRPDDITEMLALYGTKYGKPFPNAMRDGFGMALARFDGYQLAKYKSDGKAVSLVDAINICHPRGSEYCGMLVKGTLPSANTWETKLTKAGEDESLNALSGTEREEKLKELKTDAWRKLVLSGKIGYFALLRNLRNILASNDEDLITSASELLTDKRLIKRSLVMPFRFLSAIEEVEKLQNVHARTVLRALSVALDYSMDSVPKFEGKTLVALDDSGSMAGRTFAIGAIFAIALMKSSNALLCMFSDRARFITLNPDDSTLGLVQRINTQFRGHGTNMPAVFEVATQPFDRIVILSDMQTWMAGNFYGLRDANSAFERYKITHKCNPRVYSFDLQGYGQLSFPEPNVFCLAGWSEKTFDVMRHLETDRNAMIRAIDNVVI